MFDPNDIKNLIQENLECMHLTVNGDGHHFEALIVSKEFINKTKVKQHQIVYKTLGDKMREEIHALSMKTMTPEEWKKTKEKE